MRKVHSVILALAVIIILALFPATVSAVIINGTTVTVETSDHTNNIVTNTNLIQGFLNFTYSKIIIEPGPSNAAWLVKPLFFNRNNTEFHLNANTVLEAGVGYYASSDCVLTADGYNDIKVTGDAGAKILMHKEEYANLAANENRHALNFWHCNNLTISGLTLEKSGGDGIFLYAVSNATITNVVTDGCARNGLAVVGVDGLTVTYCTFKNTQGQGNCAAYGPWAGIDLEPDFSQHMKNIEIYSCTLQDNDGNGIDIYANDWTGATEKMSINVEYSVMHGNGKYGIAVACVPASLDDSSAIAFQGCEISDNNNSGICVDSKSRDGGTLSFISCNLINNNLFAGYAAFLIENDHIPSTSGGNIQLTNVNIEQPTSRIVSHSLSIDGTNGLIDNVSGTIQTFSGTSKSATGNTSNIAVTEQGVAVNKTSSASSGSNISSLANDGTYSQDNGDNCWCCANNQDVGAWWKVDLGQSLVLGKIRVQYRTFAGAYHFVPLSVTVQISSDNSNWTTVISKSANVPQEGAACSSNVPYEYFVGGVSARYVRLLFEDGGSTFSSYKLVQLVEVGVTSPEPAVNKTSSASSEGDIASLANDGIYSQNEDDNYWSCTSGQDVGAWWKIDLGQSSLALNKVRVQYRTFAGAYHFVPLSVTVQVSSDNSNWTTVVSKSANVPQEGAACSNNMLYEYSMGGASARYVRLLFEDGGSTFSIYKAVQLAEVEIVPL